MIESAPKYPVEMPMKPAIMKSVDGTKTYAVGGSVPWVLIPNDTTMENLHHYAVMKKIEMPKLLKKYGVRSSNGRTQYIVEVWNNGKTTCNCSGFRWRAKCKHTKAVNKLKR